MRKIPLLLFITLFLMSCNNKAIDEANTTVTKFMTFLRDNDQTKMQSLFPYISEYDNINKSDSIELLSSFKIDSIVVVTIRNFFTNPFNKSFEKEISFYLGSDTLGNYTQIFDTKNLIDITESEHYAFGKSHLFVTSNDTTDIQKLKGIDAGLAAILALSYGLEQLVKENVKVTSWSWEYGYSNSASGSVIVRNNTPLSLNDVTYVITYMDSKGNMVTTDDGTAFYYLPNNTTKSFSFYTSYISHASKASIELDFDEYQFYEMIMDDYQFPSIELYLSSVYGDSIINNIMNHQIIDNPK